jgi:long-chain fatty acid transport protein
MAMRTIHDKVLPGLLALCLLGGESALAINGINFYGVGARNRAMGGANAAAPVDTSTIYINPAGLGRLGNTVDFGAHVLIADRFIDRTDGTGDLVNIDGGFEQSGQPVYVTPFSGVSWRDECSPWAFGMMIGGVTGEGATYDLPRIDPDELYEPNELTSISATGDTYDTSSFILVIKAVPAVSYEVNDQLSVGAGLLVDVVLFSADLAVPGPGGRLVQTAGDGRAEVSYLLGFQLGVLYDINDCWSIGASYISHQWQLDDFAHYEDLIPGLELPPEFRVGLAYRPAEWLRLTADYKFIHWEDVGLFRRLPARGGFGWHSQHTVGIGAEMLLTSRIIGRIGWNYGRSPIDRDVTFANALFPAIYESHLAGGIELKISECHSLAFTAVGTFHTEKTDDGSGDPISQAGAGTRIGYEGFDFDATWTVRF